MLIGAGIGIGFGGIGGGIGGDPVAALLGSSEFYAPLTHSLILTRGTGDPTFTRATSAWEFDNEGKLILVPSGSARFGGARMVRNLLAATSTLSTQNVTTVATSYTLSFYGTGSVTLSGTATGTLNGTGASNRVQTTVTATAGTLTLTVSGSVTDAQLENVTGQADQTASEYVSVGVLSAPYHGAGVDGVKYFDTNKDGSPIADSLLDGYLSEPEATNNLLYCRDWLAGAKAGAWIPSTTGSAVLSDDFSSYADTAAMLAAGWTGRVNGDPTLVSGRLRVTLTSNQYGRAHRAFTTEIGKTYVATVQYVTDAVTGNAFLYANSSANGTVISEKIMGSTVGYHTTTFVAVGTTTYIEVGGSSAALSGEYMEFDNVSIYESGITVALTATGIDGAANSASTLTATANDATIFQPRTLASAARSSAIYIRRKTGTGGIYITRDGGSTWTEVTSSLNTSTYYRAKIENTSVTNPSVGIKMATSGDVIEVDYAQDEAGAFASSPIITTSAVATRNADACTFQTASNWSDTAGWVLATVQGESWANATGTAVGNSTNGLKLSASNSGIVAYDGTNTVNGPAGSPSGSEKLAMTWGSGALQAASGGVTGTAGSYDGAWGLASIGIGTSQGNVYIKDVYIGQTVLTEDQLQQVTA